MSRVQPLDAFGVLPPPLAAVVARTAAKAAQFSVYKAPELPRQARPEESAASVNHTPSAAPPGQLHEVLPQQQLPQPPTQQRSQHDLAAQQLLLHLDVTYPDGDCVTCKPTPPIVPWGSASTSACNDFF